MPHKHCELDPIQTTLFRQMINEVAPIITKNFKHFPTKWNLLDQPHRSSTPTSLKKPGLELIFKNLRPVSNLPYLSKLIEHLVCEQIVTHTKETGNLEDLQSAYRANHSTETALLRVKTDIMQAIDDQEVGMPSIAGSECSLQHGDP